MKNNKGFSLVELIIVIAIMAVLIGVLAPQYLKYVEKSRVSSDETAIADVRNAMVNSLADEAVYSNVESGATVSIDCNNGTLSGSTALLNAVTSVTGTSIKLGSKTYKKNSTITFQATFTPSDMKWTVTSFEEATAGFKS
jgi:prepilin-type N-terminal cleavage/methylation domain-containing protein